MSHRFVAVGFGSNRTFRFQSRSMETQQAGRRPKSTSSPRHSKSSPP